MVLGLALGTAALIANAFVAEQLSRIEIRSVLLWPLIRQDIRTPVLIAPVLAFLVGLIVEGPRWSIASMMILTIQGSFLSFAAVSVGLSEAAHPLRLAILLVSGAIGVALSGLAMGRAQRREARPVAEPAKQLAEIDFEKVKQQSAAVSGAASPTPATAAAPDSASPPPAPEVPAEGQAKP